MYIRVVDNNPEPYSLRLLRADNPQVSFPKDISDATLAEYGVYRTSTAPMPEYDPLVQIVTLRDPELRDGVWVQDWQIGAPSSEDKAANIRSKRNKLLAETDWWAVQDRTMSQAEVDYRQALRDITAQESFPDGVDWPTKP